MPFTKKEITKINNKFDLIVVGGGGLFLSDQDTKSARNSGWQLNIRSSLYNSFKIPFSLFAVGYNKFRGQREFNKKFITNIRKFNERSIFFSLRNYGSIRNIKNLTGIKKIKLQPCVTSYLNRFYKTPNIKREKILSIGFAADRMSYRFKNKIKLKNFLTAIEKIVYEFKKKKYKIHFVYHKDSDSIYEKFFTKKFLKNVKIKNLTNASINDTISYYKKLKIMFAMRGHHQLISIGCETPFFSLITHNKLKYLVEENKLQEFSADINLKNFNNRISQFIRDSEDNIDKIMKVVKKINLKFFMISKNNINFIFNKLI